MPILDIEQLPYLDAWLRSVLWDSKIPNLDQTADGVENTRADPEIHRLKARVPLSNGATKIVQGVREVFEILDAPKSEESRSVIQGQTPTAGKIVVIGRYLAGLNFEQSFINTLNQR